MNSFNELFSQIKFSFMNIPHVGIMDIIDIILVSYMVYKILTWIKDTRAWAVFKGLFLIIFVTIVAYVFKLNTIWWILSNTISVGIIAVFVVFQPEFRRALEQIGRGHFFTSLMVFEEPKEEERLSENTVDAIVRSARHMAKLKTGALILIEREVKLGEYERTGIAIDAVVTSQLLINIFEHNTPLHDGAVIIRNNRISAATCYLPLTDSLEVSKDLGTRHRAALGASEASDAIILVVSEETGKISYVREGRMIRGIAPEQLKVLLSDESHKKKTEKKKLVLWKGRQKHE